MLHITIKLHNLKSNSIQSIMWRHKNLSKVTQLTNKQKYTQSLNTSILGHKVTLISIFVCSNLPFHLEHTATQWYVFMGLLFAL